MRGTTYDVDRILSAHLGGKVEACKINLLTGIHETAHLIISGAVEIAKAE